MMHLTLLHVPNLGVDVIFIVEAIFLFGLSSFRDVGRSKHFFCFGGGDNSFCGGVYFFLNFKSECGTARSAQPIILFPCFALVYFILFYLV